VRTFYALADTDPTGKLLTTAPYDFYPETQWRDDMELGATELARAVGPGPQQQAYLSQPPRGPPPTSPPPIRTPSISTTWEVSPTTSWPG